MALFVNMVSCSKKVKQSNPNDNQVSTIICLGSDYELVKTLAKKYGDKEEIMQIQYKTPDYHNHTYGIGDHSSKVRSMSFLLNGEQCKGNRIWLSITEFDFKTNLYKVKEFEDIELSVSSEVRIKDKTEFINKLSGDLKKNGLLIVDSYIPEKYFDETCQNKIEIKAISVDENSKFSKIMDSRIKDLTFDEEKISSVLITLQKEIDKIEPSIKLFYKSNGNEVNEPTVTLVVPDFSLKEVLEYSAAASGLNISFEGDSIIFSR